MRKHGRAVALDMVMEPCVKRMMFRTAVSPSFYPPKR
jgi:hypothetical protein